LLGRILKKLDIKNEAIFNENEQTQLQNVFKINGTELQSILDSCSFIFAQAGYFAINPEILVIQLEKSGVANAKARSFGQSWKEEAGEYMAKLRKKAIVPLEADSIDWRLHLQIGQSNLYRLKEPTAILQVGLHTTSDIKEKSSENITMEFNHKELYELFEKLETIQEQLDNLG